MIHRILTQIDKYINFDTVKAHCDVPCGVYDPIPAQIAAMTVARMTDTIIDLEEHEVKDHNSERDFHYHNKITRMVKEKDRSGSIIKEEINIIWGDFYKAPQFEQFPELHELAHGIMLKASKCKQNVDKEASRELVEQLNKFAEIFRKIKGINSKRVTYHCKPNLEIVFPEL